MNLTDGNWTQQPTAFVFPLCAAKNRIALASRPDRVEGVELTGKGIARPVPLWPDTIYAYYIRRAPNGTTFGWWLDGSSAVAATAAHPLLRRAHCTDRGESTTSRPPLVPISSITVRSVDRRNGLRPRSGNQKRSVHPIGCSNGSRRRDVRSEDRARHHCRVEGMVARQSPAPASVPSVSVVHHVLLLVRVLLWTVYIGLEWRRPPHVG